MDPRTTAAQPPPCSRQLQVLNFALDFVEKSGLTALGNGNSKAKRQLAGAIRIPSCPGRDLRRKPLSGHLLQSSKLDLSRRDPGQRKAGCETQRPASHKVYLGPASPQKLSSTTSHLTYPTFNQAQKPPTCNQRSDPPGLIEKLRRMNLTNGNNRIINRFYKTGNRSSKSQKGPVLFRFCPVPFRDCNCCSMRSRW